MLLLKVKSSNIVEMNSQVYYNAYLNLALGSKGKHSFGYLHVTRKHDLESFHKESTNKGG